MQQLKEAGKNPRKLLNLRKRLARIRVFDPACGSGNFLVIAYKEMRKIEAEINILRGEPDRASEIPLTNFRGIELRHFAVEIARLALIIAEYQCDELVSWSTLGACRVPSAQQRELDHSRQRFATGLVEGLSAHRNRRRQAS
jgi:type I restriction-modification system DNA methylase subunit